MSQLRKLPKMSIVMPAYNEANHIVANLLETVRFFVELNCDFEVILVDDGSPDQTFLHAVAVLTEYPEVIRIIHYDENKGKGNALICGAWYARGDYIVFLDADMDIHPVQIPTFFDIMDAKGADVVIGSKWHPLSNITYPWKRRLYSALYYGVVRLLFGLPIRDTQTGLKVFKRSVAQHVFPRILAKRFAFDVEVLANAHRLGYKIADAPITLDFRRQLGRIKWNDIRNMLLDTCAIFYRMHILHYYDRLPNESLAELPLGRGAREIIAPQETVELI